ncbi:MAG: hypothetical protein ACT4QD_04030 [Acidobacteriota bacterium]
MEPSVSHEPARGWAAWAVTAIGAGTLVAPSAVWIGHDRSVWSWDPSFYGFGAVDLWHRLTADPARWWELLTTVYSAKAPGIGWLGQFFVPVGLWIGSIEAGLLISVLALQALSVMLVFGTSLALKASRLHAVAAMLLVAAGPLFISMSHHFMTEAFQLFAVSYMYWVAALSPSKPRAWTVGHSALSLSAALLAKINTPAFLVMPLAIAVYEVQRGRLSEGRVRLRDLAVYALGLLVTVPGTVWYLRNGSATWDFARLNVASDVALLYGHEAAFLDKVPYWLGVLGQSLVSVPDLALVAMAGALGALMYALSSPDTASPVRSVAHPRLVVAAGLQVLLVITLLSLAVNEEARFALALVPSIGVLFVWMLSRLRLQALAAGCIVALLVQWGTVHARQLGVFGLHDESYWAQPPRRDDWRSAEVAKTVAATCNEQSHGRYVMTGVNLDWLNFYTLSFYSWKAQLSNHKRCHYWYLGLAERDPEVAWARVIEFDAPYFVSLEESAMPEPPDILNLVAADVLRRVASSAAFVRERLESTAGIVAYRRVEGSGGVP